MARIRSDEKLTVEHFSGVHKIETVFADVGAIRGGIPFKSHCNSKGSYIQAECMTAFVPWQYRFQRRTSYEIPSAR
jgi:hypothetical protein